MSAHGTAQGHQILTRHDKTTGQPLFDYYLRQVVRPGGKFERRIPEPGYRHVFTTVRYDVEMVVTKRYAIA